MYIRPLERNMFLGYFILCSCLWNFALLQEIEILSNVLESSNTPIKVIEADVFYTEMIASQDKVTIQLFYESLCPDCMRFDPQFVSVVKKLQNHLNIRTYPYGNAQTVVYDNGTIQFRCQHGPDECYGNKLHACAIDILADITKALDFNSCMMSNRSNDQSADECGKRMKIDAEPIKKCAKGDKGIQLLKYYGEESHKAGFNYVPYVLVNGKEWSGDTEAELMQALCGAFAVRPPACATSFE